MGDSSSQRVGEWGGVMSVERDSVAGQLFNLIDVFITMITSWALLDRGLDATVDDSCEDSKMYY